MTANEEAGKATTANPASRTTGMVPPAPPQGSPASGDNVDLSAWKAPAPSAPEAKAPTTQRKRHPLVKWDALAVVEGPLRLVDVWVAVSDPKPPTKERPQGTPSYEYAGANVLLPPNARYPEGLVVTALTGTDTTAGGRLKAGLLAGTFDGLKNVPPATVVVKPTVGYSTDPERRAKPYVQLLFG